jgi:outer membrane protein TolC
MIKVRPTLALILLALALAWPRAAIAQDVKTYTLDEIQSLAASYYQAVGISRARAEQAREMERMAFGARLPTIATAGVVTSNVVTASLTFNDFTIDLLPRVDYNFAVSAVQPLFTGFRLEKAQRQAELGVLVAKTGVGITVQDTVLAATRAFYGVLGLLENVEISRRAVEVAQQTLRTAESLYRAGEAVETSVLRARVAESDARRELLVAENALVLGRHQLMLLTGLTGEFQLTQPPATKRIDTPVEDLITLGLGTRPELKALALERQIAGLEVDRQRGQWYPTIEAHAAYVKQKATFPSSQLASVAVNAVWPIFDGGRRGAAVATAKSSLTEAGLQEELARRQTAEQIRAAYVAMQTLSASVDLLKSQVEVARRNGDETGKAYQVGEATDLDVLQSNNALTQSERQLAQATFQYEMSICDLLRAIGTFAAYLAPQTSGGHE